MRKQNEEKPEKTVKKTPVGARGSLSDSEQLKKKEGEKKTDKVSEKPDKHAEKSERNFQRREQSEDKPEKTNKKTYFGTGRNDSDAEQQHKKKEGERKTDKVLEKPDRHAEKSDRNIPRQDSSVGASAKKTMVQKDQEKFMKIAQRKMPKSFFQNSVKVKMADDELSSEEEAGSDIQVTSHHNIRHQRRLSKLSMLSAAGFSASNSTVDSGSYSNNDSLGSSIHKFRDDFEGFKCKMKIFGESLNLCKCIASDFKGKLKYMDKRLQLLERRQRKSRAESNYTAIIQKNKQLSTKTKEYVKKLQMCGTEDEMREVAARICKNYLHGLWKVAEPTDLQFRKITGGLSNFIYLVGLPEDLKPLYARMDPADEEDAQGMNAGMETIEEPKKVLLRIYGQVHGDRAMDAIVTESVIFTLLSERRLGPKLFGVFSGGRIEEYIPSRSLLTKELSEPALSMKIAEKTAGIHSMEIPLSKEPNYIWKTMGKWMKTVREECFVNGVKGKNEIEQTAIRVLKEVNFEHEVEWLKKLVLAVESPVVFCHNDLQEGNILLLDDHQPTTCDGFESPTFVQTYDVLSPRSSKDNQIDKDVVCRKSSNHLTEPECVMSHENIENRASKAAFISSTQAFKNRATFMEDHLDANTSDTVLSHDSDSGEPKLYLIDFEYCAYNYRGFDIANHFQEWAYDYTNPNPPFYFENQENWPTLEQKEIFIREYLKHYHASTSDDKEMVEPHIDAINKLLVEVDAFALASHLFWTLWSIVNASKSQIPFGYWEYGQSRLETYLRLKQEVIKKDKFGLPQKRKIEEVDI